MEWTFQEGDHVVLVTTHTHDGRTFTNEALVGDTGVVTELLKYGGVCVRWHDGASLNGGINGESHVDEGCLALAVTKFGDLQSVEEFLND